MRDNAVVVRLPARVRSQSGAELVEFALVLPILLLVFGGIVDFGLLLQRQQVITNAAREGARLAVLPGYCSGDVEERVRRFVQEGLNSPSAAPTTLVEPITVPLGTAPPIPARRVNVATGAALSLLMPSRTNCVTRAWTSAVV